MLREDLIAPGKQRHTAKWIFERLVDEHDARVSYSTVSKYVHRRRPEIIAGQRRAEAAGVAGFVPQAKEPGAEAEVDFADVFVELAGRLARCYLFGFRLSYSGRGCHRVHAGCAQEAFLEGHVTAFEATGGVPWRHVRYDKLSPAVAKVRHGVAGVRDHAVIQLVVQLRELGPDLGLGLAGDLLAPPLAVRAGLEADYTTPAARTMPMGLRVAAVP